MQRTAAAEKGNDLAKVLRACPEVQTYYPGALRNWQDADRIAETLSPMMGIEMPVLSDARAAMGRKEAATAVMCMLEKLGTIRSPGAYLRRLAQKARAGQFSTAPMLNALLQAGNPAESCQLTIFCRLTGTGGQAYVRSGRVFQLV